MPDSALTDLLSRKQQLAYARLTETLPLMQAGLGYLVLIGVDSPRLGQAIEADLIARVGEGDGPGLLWVDREHGLPSRFPQRLTRYQQRQQLVLIPTYEANPAQYRSIAAQLLYERDALTRLALPFIFLVPTALYDIIQAQAYDFISATGLALRLADQAAQVERDFQPPANIPAEVEEFQEAVTDLQEYRAKEDAKPDMLVKKLLVAGNKAYAITRLEVASKYYEECLHLARREENQYYESAALGNIGLIYRSKGDLDEALKYHQLALEIDRKIGYLQGEASDLGNIGLIYSDKGDLDEALKYLQGALDIHRKIGYLQGEANQLGNIGLIYSDKGDLDEALKYTREALRLAEAIGYAEGMRIWTGNIDEWTKGE